jgi:peptidoglycan/LPS O-acetylase OafA/YrhL
MAILIVLAFHLIGSHDAATILPHKLQGLLGFGWSGVDLFFVLSGFLIGGILIDAKDATNYFKVFYVRRFYRILPLYGALCLLSAVVFWMPLSTHTWLFGGDVPWYSYLTFGQNFWMAKANSTGGSQMGPTWSLAVEEQFYLTLPFVIRVFSRKTLPYAVGVGVLLAPVIRIALWFAVGPVYGGNVTYLLMPCRMDGLLLGVLAAIAVRNQSSWNWLVTHTRFIGTASALLGLGVLGMIRKKIIFGTFDLASFGFTWVALFYLSLLLLAITKQGLVNRIFRLRALTGMGALAYSLYLLHFPMLGIVYGMAGKAAPTVTGLSSAGLTLLSGALVVGLARVSWLYFERPLVKRGHRYQYRHDEKEQKAEVAWGLSGGKN